MTFQILGPSGPDLLNLGKRPKRTNYQLTRHMERCAPDDPRDFGACPKLMNLLERRHNFSITRTRIH